VQKPNQMVAGEAPNSGHVRTCGQVMTLQNLGRQWWRSIQHARETLAMPATHDKGASVSMTTRLTHNMFTVRTWTHAVHKKSLRCNLYYWSGR